MTATPRDTRIAMLVPRDRTVDDSRRDPLSKAKLAPPRSPAHVVAAARYRQWLAPVLTHDITLVSAPPGYGKTVFAAELYREMRDTGFSAAWISCYPATDGRLADYIAEAIAAAMGESGTAAASGGADSAIDLSNRIHGHDCPILLCLDDVDQIASAEDIAFLAGLIGHCPTNLHFLLTCRDDRRLPAALIDQRGSVQRLGIRVLRARDAEMAEYLSFEGVPTGGDWTRALNDVLGGWWRAMQRAAPVLRDGGWSTSPDDWQRRAGQWVAPLLADTLTDMPAGHRTLLAQCAVARTLTSGLAAHLTGNPKAGAVLGEIARSGHFVEGGSTPDHYVIHPALRALLLTDAAHAPAGAEAARALAIDWYVRCGDPREAIAVAVSGGDAETIADLVIRHGMAAIELCGPAEVADAIERLPRTRIVGDPALAGIAALVAAIAHGEMPEPGLPGLGDAAASATIEGIAAFSCAAAPPMAVEAIPAATDFPTRLLTTLQANAALRLGDHRQAQAMLRPLIRQGRASGIGFAEAVAQSTMADLHRAEGRPGDAERLLREALTRLAPGAGRQSGTAAILAVALADIQYLRNDIASASALIDEYLPALAAIGFPELLLRGYRTAIRVAAASARPEEALALIEAAEEIGSDRDLPILAALGAVERLRLHIPLVVEFDEILSPDGEEAAIAAAGSPDARVFALMSEARAFEAIANLDRPRLTVVADRLLALAHGVQDVELRLVGTLLNVLPQLSGRCDRMVEIETVRFLNWGASMGFVRPIIDLLEITGVRTSQDFNRADYSAGSFLALLRLSRPIDSEPPNGHAPAGSAFSFFTSREMEIVNALNEGETNKMIARKLGVTPETVKWHMKSLMRKLRANSREEVVNNALVLGVSFASTGRALQFDPDDGLHRRI